MLTRLGYLVELAGDGLEAITLYRRAMESGLAFDAVILDLTVPGGMGGEETIQRLREIDPEVKAIVSSGYFHNSLMDEYKKYGLKGIIPKPYHIEEISEVLHKVILE